MVLCFVVAAAAVILAQLLCRLTLGYSWFQRKNVLGKILSFTACGDIFI